MPVALLGRLGRKKEEKDRKEKGGGERAEEGKKPETKTERTTIIAFGDNESE